MLNKEFCTTIQPNNQRTSKPTTSEILIRFRRGKDSFTYIQNMQQYRPTGGGQAFCKMNFPQRSILTADESSKQLKQQPRFSEVWTQHKKRKNHVSKQTNPPKIEQHTELLRSKDAAQRLLNDQHLSNGDVTCCNQVSAFGIKRNLANLNHGFVHQWMWIPFFG